MAVHPHDPGERLHQRIVTWKISADRSRAKRIEGVIKNAGINRTHCVLANSDTLSNTRPHALQEDIGARRYRQRRCSSRWRTQVEHHAALSNIHMTMDYTGPIHSRRPSASIIPAWCLDLDDVSAKLGKDHGGVGPCHVGREIEDPHALERDKWRMAKRGVGSARICHRTL